ncbi:MAG TPA: 30S ribosomal protein S6 [Ruania sp.]|nr:30S ribosomal protein S6 [Ruania sp.]
MRHYEMMVILDPAIDERTVPAALEKFLGVITSGGGTVDKTDVWGRRRLAYDIDKNSEGIYAVVDMHATPDLAQELDRQLGLNESVIRTKLIRPDAR